MEANLLIFDLDGTIIDVFGCGRKAIRTTMRKMFGVKRAGENLDFPSSTDYVILSKISKQFDLKEAFFERINEFQSIYAEELKNEIKRSRTAKLLPGFPELLRHLNLDPRWYLSLATGNMKAGAITKLRYFGLEEYFPTVGFGDNARNKKEVIELGLKDARKFFKNDFKKGKIFVIGDTILDIEAAKKLGLNSIAVATGFEEKEKLTQAQPDWLFDDLSCIDTFLKVINSHSHKKETEE